MTVPKFKVTFQERRTYFTTYAVEAETEEQAIEAVTMRGEGEEIDDEFESTDERTHWKTTKEE